MSGGSNVLEKVQRGHLCTGCGACAAIANGVRMERARSGFTRPVTTAPVTAAEEERIATVCPGLTVSRPTARSGSPLWGHVVALRTGHATDPELRFKGASGGALSALLVHLLESDLVDFVVQTGADPSDPAANQSRVSSTAGQVALSAGSRYAPSSPLAEIEDHLATGKRFAFVGKPCDVAALRAMARTDPRIDANVVCMISFFCAGVPSMQGAQTLLNRLGVQQGFLKAFRYRGHGWPGAATARLADGSQRQMSYRESWGDVLSKHVQFRCKICPDGTANQADIVCADAWHGDQHGYPSFEESDGKSLILTRTDRGEAIVQSALRLGAITAASQESSALERMQPGQVTRMRMLVARLAALCVTLQPRPRFHGFALYRMANGASPIALLRNFLGTGRRVILGRR